ncbi:MAG: molybdopterin-binding protein [Eubacteriales bacterium]|nr:molybdopterin-binding protein [Eubacteriales bacterium]
MGIIHAICISEKRGTPKKRIEKALLKADWGIVGDAHAGSWHRQVSLLGKEQIDGFRASGAEVSDGAFGENLVVSGFDLRTLPVGTLLRVKDALLEITQIGKECHSHCEIYKRMGDCIMPREGIFARVLIGGEISVGDELTVALRTEAFPFQAAVITASDAGAKGERTDESGPAIAARLSEAGYVVTEQLLISDDPAPITKNLIRLCDQRQLDLILTTGGTGFSSRDHMPEATLAAAERIAPGIAEAIRAASMKITPRAMLSRGVSVIRGKTLIINLPGSPKACMECMDVFMDVLPHALKLLRDEDGNCARR